MIDIDTFFASPEDNLHCVHAATEEEARIVMGWFIDRGQPKWHGGGSRAEETKWHIYRENTVYYPGGVYGSVQYAENCSHTIYEVSDFTTAQMAWNEVFVNE